MHTVFALLCFVVVIDWLIFPYPSGLLHWHCGNLTIAPVPAKQPWWIWMNTSCEFIMNGCITTTKQSRTKPCAYFLGYTVCVDGFISTPHNGDYNNPAEYTICHPNDSLPNIIAYPITQQVVQSITTVARFWRCTLYRQLKINSKWCNGIDFFYDCPAADFQNANDSSNPRARGQY